MGEQEGKECMMGLAREDGVMGWDGRKKKRQQQAQSRC